MDDAEQPPFPRASTPSVLALCFDHGSRLGAGRRRARSDRRDGRQRCQTGTEPAREGREPARLRGVRRADPRSAAPGIAGRPEVRPVPIRGGPARRAAEPLQPPRQQRQPAEVGGGPSRRYQPRSGTGGRHRRRDGRDRDWRRARCPRRGLCHPGRQLGLRRVSWGGGAADACRGRRACRHDVDERNDDGAARLHLLRGRR